ncbi:MAG: CAP domain-containing protein [Burkholderiaceae bacterium]
MSLRKPVPPGRDLSRMLVTAALALAAALLLSLEGCGGGGSDSPGSTQNAASANAMPTDATCSLPDFSAELLQRVNALRAAGATCGTTAYPSASPLAWNAALTQASALHSQDMATANYFTHNSQDGRTPGDRITAAGYAWQTYGENIAAGYDTVQAAVDAWIASPGHCANLMNAAFRDIGVACVPRVGSSTYRTYWTMDLGATR